MTFKVKIGALQIGYGRDDRPAGRARERRHTGSGSSSPSSSPDLAPRCRHGDETGSVASSSRQGGQRNGVRPHAAGSRSSVPDPAATDFDTGLAHWVAQARDEPPPARRRAKLPSSKHEYKSANFLFKSKDSAGDALCTEERRGEAGMRIDKAKTKAEDTLDLENLGLTGLPAQIGDLSRVKDLNLNFNKLKSLPDQFSQLGRLKILNAGGVNEFSSFPRVILKLENLVHLDLSGNRLRHIPTDIGNLTHLTRLHLDSNYIEKLPHQIYRLTKLQVFSAASNPYLSTVPTDMGMLTQLKRVDLSNTQIATLPGWNHLIEERLVSLNLFRTNFSGFDERLKMPKRMKLVDLGFTKVATLPPSFGPMTFYGNAEGNILRTTHKPAWSENVKFKVEGTNLPSELNREARMVTDQPIKQLTPLRHELRLPPVENQDNDVDSGSDDGGDIDFHMRWLGNTGPANLAHAQRVREATVNRMPTGRVADFAAARAAEEFADRWGETPVQPPTLHPWGNEPVPPMPGADMRVAWQPGVQSGMPVGGMPSGLGAGRWADRIRQTGNPAYVAPPAAVPLQVGAGWGLPPMPAGMGLPPGPWQQPGMGLQPQAALNPLLAGIEQLNALAQLMSLGTMPAPGAPAQNVPAGFAPGPGLMQQPGDLQQPGMASAQAAGERPPGIYLSPSVPPGGYMPAPMWAPQPTVTGAASELPGNMGALLTNTVADMAESVSSLLRRRRQ